MEDNLCREGIERAEGVRCNEEGPEERSIKGKRKRKRERGFTAVRETIKYRASVFYHSARFDYPYFCIQS